MVSVVSMDPDGTSSRSLSSIGDPHGISARNVNSIGDPPQTYETRTGAEGNNDTTPEIVTTRGMKQKPRPDKVYPEKGNTTFRKVINKKLPPSNNANISDSKPVPSINIPSSARESTNALVSPPKTPGSPSQAGSFLSAAPTNETRPFFSSIDQSTYMSKSVEADTFSTYTDERHDDHEARGHSDEREGGDREQGSWSWLDCTYHNPLDEELKSLQDLKTMSENKKATEQNRKGEASNEEQGENDLPFSWFDQNDSDEKKKHVQSSGRNLQPPLSPDSLDTNEVKTIDCCIGPTSGGNKKVDAETAKTQGVWDAFIALIDPEPELEMHKLERPLYHAADVDQRVAVEEQRVAGEPETAPIIQDEYHSNTDEEERLFNDDLKSIPSVKEDILFPGVAAKEEMNGLNLVLPAGLDNSGETSSKQSVGKRSVSKNDTVDVMPGSKSQQEIESTLMETEEVVASFVEAKPSPEMEIRQSTQQATKPVGRTSFEISKTRDDNQEMKKKSEESVDARRNLLVKELRAAIAAYGRYDVRCANISAALGDLLDESDQREQAVRLHKDAVTIYSCKLGDEHATTMNAKIRLGTVLENAGQYDEAVSTYYAVAVMRRSLKGDKDPSAADCLVHVAHVLRKKGDYMIAIKELKQALKVYREALGDAHEKVSSTVDEIASLYITIGDFIKSAAILEEVVKLKASTAGPQSKQVALALASLATTYECSEDFFNAMKTLKKAYKIYTEIGGYTSEDATATLNRMAQLYEVMGDYHRASIAFLGVLRGRKALYGMESIKVAETYYRLGHALRKTGQLDKALKCMKEALPIFVAKGIDGNEVDLIADVMNEMAQISTQKKNFVDAARVLKRELSVRRKLGQSDFPLIARNLNHLGVSEYELKNYGQALKYLVESLTIYQKHDERGIDCAEALFNTGLVFEAVRNKERALDAFTEAARIFRDHGYGEDHPHLIKACQKIKKLESKGVSNLVLKKIFN